MAPSTYRLQLLGGFNLTAGEGALSKVAKGRSPALLTYLILNRQAPQSRQSLAFALWPDSTDAQARTNLRRELHRLRKLLPSFEHWIQGERGSMQWLGAGCQVDVVDFERAIARANAVAGGDDSDIRIEALTAAIELYRGQLLPDAFDEWLDLERDRLQHAFTDALEQVLALFTEQAEYRRAIPYARQLLRIDPLQENAYRSLMTLYADSGDRSSALRVYQDCLTCLDRELGVPPSPTTRLLFERILREDRAPVRDLSPTNSTPPRPAPLLPVAPLPKPAQLPPLVGRAREWTTISQWYGNGGESSPTLLLVGEGGIGKTRLLDELVVLAQANGGQVLRGRGFEAEMVRPYGAWTDALRQALATEDSVPDELSDLLQNSGNSAVSDRSCLFDAIVQLLQQLARSQSLIIQMDDIQWLDSASIALLHYAVRVLSAFPIHVVCAARPQELQANLSANQFLQALQREQQLQRLELSALDEPSIAELTGKPEGDPDTRQIYASSGGNPLFALELARGYAPDPDPLSRLASTPQSIESIIQARLQQLDPTSRDLLQWAAAIGRGFFPMLLAEIAGGSVLQLLGALEQLEQIGIVRPRLTDRSDEAVSGEEIGYDFAHDIVRQTVYQQLSAPRRQLIHRHIARSLHAISPSKYVGEVAHHAAQGQDWQLAASAAATAAAQSLRIFAFSEAAELAHRGLDCCQHLEVTERLSLQLSLLECCIFAGLPRDRRLDIQKAIEGLISEARSLHLKDEEAKGLQVMMMLNFDSGNIVELTENSLKAADLGRGASVITQAKTLASAGGCLASIGREMAKAEALLLEAQSLAERVELELCDIPAGLGMVALYRGDFYIAKQLLLYALKLAPLEHEIWLQSICLTRLAQVELDEHQPEQALPYCQQLKVLANKMPGGSEGAFANALAALARYSLQRAGAEKELKEAIAALHRLDAKRMLAYVLTYAAKLDLQACRQEGDRLELAIERAAGAWRAAEVVCQPTEIALAGAILIQALVARGQLDAARERLVTLEEDLEQEPISQQARVSLAAAAQAVGDTIRR